MARGAGMVEEGGACIASGPIIKHPPTTTTTTSHMHTPPDVSQDPTITPLPPTQTRPQIHGRSHPTHHTPYQGLVLEAACSHTRMQLYILDTHTHTRTHMRLPLEVIAEGGHCVGAGAQQRGEWVRALWGGQQC